MPAKKTKKSADGARYLLSADRKFRRLSLKKISERVKSARRRTSARSSAKAVTPLETPVRAAHKTSPSDVPVAYVLGGAVVFAALVGVLFSSPSSLNATENAEVLAADVASAPALPVESVAVSPVETQSPTATPSPATVAPSPKASPAPAAVTTKATSRPAVEETVRAEIVPAPSPVVRSAALVEAQPEVASASIDTVTTITGCLDHDGKSAWLKDTSGVDAPKTRSWRSGFLKKSSPRIALVDGPARASAYDGRRVSVTGVLVDREMRVSSVNPIDGKCE